MKIVSKNYEQPDITYSFKEGHPKEGCFYVIGFDPAGAGSGGANSVARVWCDRPRCLVGEAIGNASEEIWAKELEKLGWHFSGNITRKGKKEAYPAWIAIEVFSYGRIVISILQTGNELYKVKPYPNIYHEPKAADLKMGIHRPTGAAGWGAGGGETRNKRSGFLFPAAQEALQFANEHLGTLPDAAGVMEYINTKWIDGRPDPAPGEKIDRVVADGLAWLCLKQNLFVYPNEPEQPPLKETFYVKDDKIMFNPLAKPKARKRTWFR